jgi:hypothetical protein
MNQHEIDFAEQTSQRAMQDSKDITKYFIKVLEVSLSWAGTLKLWDMKTHHPEVAFKASDWKIRIYNYSFNTNFNTFRFYYKGKKIIDFIWHADPKWNIVIDRVEKFDIENIFTDSVSQG